MTNGKTVLLVDDDPGIVYSYEKALNLDGFDVYSFTDPVPALDSFKTQPQSYDLIIADIKMPKIDGFELAKRLKDIRSDIRVVLMTAFEICEDKNGSQESHFDELVHKPLTALQLTNMVRKQLVPTKREKLDKIYFCKKCNASFIFEFDVQEHKDRTGHLEMHETHLE